MQFQAQAAKKSQMNDVLVYHSTGWRPGGGGVTSTCDHEHPEALPSFTSALEGALEVDELAAKHQAIKHLVLHQVLAPSVGRPNTEVAPLLHPSTETAANLRRSCKETWCHCSTEKERCGRLRYGARESFISLAARSRIPGHLSETRC